MAGGVHRLGDFVSPHPCPPFSPKGLGFPSLAIIGCPTVFANGSGVVVVGFIDLPHPCTDFKTWSWHPGLYIRPRNVLAEGSPIQAMNDMNSCAAVLITGSPNVIVGD